MSLRTVRRWVLILLLSATFMISHAAFAADPQSFDIAPGDLKAALDTLARQAGLELVYPAASLQGWQTQGVHAVLSAQDAIATILEGTPFVVKADSGGAMVIVARANATGGVQFNIPPGDLGPALKAFSEQAHLTLKYSDRLVRGRHTQGLSGSYASAEALKRLLTGTGLEATAANASTYVLKTLPKPKTSAVGPTPEGSEHVLVAGAPLTPYQPGGNVDIPRTINDVQPYYIFDSETIEQSGALDVEDFLKQRLTMNTTYQTSSQMYGTNNGFNGAGANTTSSINLRGLGTNETLILVDGHRMAGVTITGTTGQPDVNGIPLAAIDRIEVLPSSASGIYGGSALGGVVNIILKKNYQGGEVRLSYDKPESSHASTPTLDGNYGFSLEDGKTHVMLVAHYSDSEPLLTGDRSEFIERGINTINANCPGCLYSQGIFPGGTTPNILGLNSNYSPQNLILGNGTVFSSPYAHIAPGCTKSDPLISCLLPGYSFNLSPGYGPYGLEQPMGSFSRVSSLMAVANRQMSSWLNLFANVQVDENDARSEYAPIGGSSQFMSNINYLGNNVFIPGKTPFQNASVYFTVPSVESEVNSGYSATRTVTLGGIASLPRGWSAEADYTWSKNEFSARYDGFDGTTFSTDVQSGAIDPFVDVLAYPPNLSHYLTTSTSDSSSTLNDLALRSVGPLWHLPWGDPTLAGSVEVLRESTPESTQYDPIAVSNDAAPPGFNYAGALFPFIYFPQSQTSTSAYLEGTLPLVTAKNAVWGIRLLEVQLADRWEDYSVVTGTTSEQILDDVSPPAILYSPTPTNAVECPSAISYYGSTCGGTPSRTETGYRINSKTAGLKYKPVEDVIARVSYATAFLPPTYSQLLPNPIVNVDGDTITDPKTGQTYQVNTITGGNPNLTPQTSKSWDGGLIFEPHDNALEGLRLDLEYYRISQFNYITQPTGNEILSSPTFAGRVIRNAAGVITLINETDINAPQFNTEGWDLSANYHATTTWGTFDFRAAGTLIKDEDRQYVINGPTNDFVGWPDEGGEGKYKATGSMIWSNRGWTLGWTTTWFSAYHVNETPGDPVYVYTGPSSPFQEQGSAHIPSQSYHDLLASYTFGQTESHGVLSNLKIQLIVKDVFNSVPPFDAAILPFYYSQYGDPNLRTFQLSLRKSF
jgi:iron complex outermembrane recepter protein